MATRESITTLFHVRGQSGSSRLIAGTKSRIYMNTGDSGSWRLLRWVADAAPETKLPSTRWRFAQLGGIIVATDNTIYPQWFSYNKPPGANGMTTEPIDDCIALGVTQVKIVASWKGFMFYGNVVQEGATLKNRMLWSDFNDPLSLQPLPDSAADYVDLQTDEEILAAHTIGGRFRVFTNRAIYDVKLVGGDEIFNFEEIYRGPMAMAYENSLINTGDKHIYAAETDLVVMSEFDRVPIQQQWLTAAAGAIFKGAPLELVKGLDDAGVQVLEPLNKTFCQSLIGAYDEAMETCWLSWATEADESGYASVSMILQPEYLKASIVDYGFTALCAHVPSYNLSWRKYLGDLGVCEPFPMASESDPEPIGYLEDTSITSIRNPDEDPEQDPHINSICRKIANNPELEPDCNPCGVGWIFVMADAVDWTLKQFTPETYYREVCEIGPDAANWTTTSHPFSDATYIQTGYASVFQSDAIVFGTPSNKKLHRIVVSTDSPDEVDANAAWMHAQVGYGAQPARLLWDNDLEPVRIDELSEATDAEHVADNTRPERQIVFPCYRVGTNISVRLVIGDADGEPIIGGKTSINGVVLKLQGSHYDWKL